MAGRFTAIAIMVLVFSFGLTAVNQINTCYRQGCPAYDIHPYDGNTIEMSASSSGSPLFFVEFTPIISNPFSVGRDSKNNVVNFTDMNTMGNMTEGVLSYKSVSAQIGDITSPLSFLTIGLAYIIDGALTFFNIITLPVNGLPYFLQTYCYIPAFIVWPICVMLQINQLVFLYELLTNKLLA